jgi:hypothetical protein
MPVMRWRSQRPCRRLDVSDAASRLEAALAEARARLAVLELREQEHRESEQVQAIL